MRSFPATLLSAVLITCAVSVSAQQFPTRPVRMIVPFVAGGGADVTARRLAEQLGAVWKQPVVIQNSGGAGGNLAVAAAASSEPTGYTVLFASVAIIANNPTLYEKLPFNPDKDLAPVILLGEVPLVLMVSATLPATDVPSFIALARKQPGTLHFGSGGIGTSMHLAGELLKSVAGIDLVHVPFKGANQVIAAIMGNEIQFIFQNAALVEGQVKGGRVKALGIASQKRLGTLPDLPTFEESGVPNFRAGISYGIYVRSGTPAPVISTLNRDIQAVLDDPAYRKQMTALGFELGGGTPQQLRTHVQAEKKKMDSDHSQARDQRQLKTGGHLSMRFSRALFAICLCALATVTWSQTYPSKPIRLLVGFTAGGNADLTGRVIAAKLAQALGTTIVVENRTGAAGSIAANIVARAPPDGYTLMLASPGALTINRILEKNLPYDPDTAFVPIGMVAIFCNALTARQDFAASSVAQLIALAKEKPGQLNFGSQGIGSAGFLSGQLMQQLAGIKLTHVPYKGGADATTALVGGELHLNFSSVTAALALRSRLKVLAVTSLARDPGLPDAPTMDESGLKGYDATFWFGLAAPVRTPQAIVTRLNALLRAAVSDAEVVKTLQSQGINPAPSSPQELTARMRADYVKWKRVIEGS